MNNRTLKDLIYSSGSVLDSDYHDEQNGMFDSLFDQMEMCPECGYEGPLTLRKRGYQCPDCQTLILPTL